MRRPAGQRNKLVIIQRATSIKDDYGEPIETWAEIGQVLAAIIYGRGDERRQAAMEQGMQPATFQALSSDVTRKVQLRDRLIAEGMIWDVRGVVRDSPQRGTVEFVAVANPDMAV
jgi:head-tail adaptor